jgi:hypothetical protein
MRVSEQFARWICPDLGERADRYWFLASEIEFCHRWLCEFPDVDLTLQRLREIDRDHWRTLGTPSTGKLPYSIGAFRELLRDRAKSQSQQEG